MFDDNDPYAIGLAASRTPACPLTGCKSAQITIHQGRFAAASSSICQQDQTLPLLSTLLGFSIARYLYLGQVGRSSTGVTGDCTILEDVFRRERSVPLSTCEDFSILKTFLEFHYRGTTAEVFIKTGRFNMMLGSRRGLVIRDTDWSSQGRIKSRQRVVMAVYLETDVKNCIVCSSELTSMEGGVFFCMLCERWFRDYDTLKYFSQPVSSPVDQSQLAACLLPTRALATPCLPVRIEEVEDDDDAVDLDGLQYVDLRLRQWWKQDGTHAEPAEKGELERYLRSALVSLIDQAEKAEEMLSHPCAQDRNSRRTIKKAIIKLMSLSAVLREITRLIEVDTESGLVIIERDPKRIYGEFQCALADIWECLDRLERDVTVKDYMQTWKEITETSWRKEGRSMDGGLKESNRLLQCFNQALAFHLRWSMGCSSQF